MQMNVWKDGSAAWPVANPVLTCASVSDAGFPSNFVADPFLYAQVLILFHIHFFFPFEFHFLYFVDVLWICCLLVNN